MQHRKAVLICTCPTIIHFPYQPRLSDIRFFNPVDLFSAWVVAYLFSISCLVQLTTVHDVGFISFPRALAKGYPHSILDAAIRIRAFHDHNPRAFSQLSPTKGGRGCKHLRCRYSCTALCRAHVCIFLKSAPGIASDLSIAASSLSGC